MPQAEPGDFTGEHSKDDIYTAANLRPIDIIMELFTMLKADKMYGQPGTDGSFWSNITETIKNDNDVLSIFKLNKAHPFNKQERMIFLGISIFLNMMVNSSLGTVEGINKTLGSLIVSLALVAIKKLLRFVYEAPCMSHDSAASDLRDGKDPDEVVRANELRQQSIQGPVNYFLYFVCFGCGAGAIFTAYSNLEIAQYIITFVVNVLVFAIINVVFSIMFGKYGKDREEFEKKYGALMYDGEYLHPKNIGDVAMAVVKSHGGRNNALKHLDSKSSSDYYEYFCLEGEGNDDLIQPETIENIRKTFACLNMDERMSEKYLARFDGQERLNPYDIESKPKLYGNAVEMGKL